MCPVLCLSQPISHFQHVGIIPMTRACILTYRILRVNDPHDALLLPVTMVEHAVKKVGNISGCSPQMPHGCCPSPWLICSPFTQTKDNGAPGILQCLAHCCIRFLCILPFSIAPVELQVINVP